MYKDKPKSKPNFNKEGKKLLDSRKPSFRDERLRHKTSMNKAKEKTRRGLTEKGHLTERKYDTIDRAIYGLQGMAQGVNVTNAATQGGNSDQILSQTGINPANGGGNVG